MRAEQYDTFLLSFVYLPVALLLSEQPKSLGVQQASKQP